VIAPDLPGLGVCQLIDENVQMEMQCDSCGHRATWTRTHMERKLRKLRGVTLGRVAQQIRCGCGSKDIRVWRT
jgi:hypothetical protein